MIRWLVGWSLRYRLLVLGIAAAAMVLGAVQVSRMPVEVLPEFTPPYVEVQTEALGLSADEVEQLITVPLEADLLHGVAWLDEIRSESVAGLSSIVLLFEPGTDIFRARQVVAERLTQAHALPNVSKPPEMLQPLSSTSRVLMVSLSSRDVSLIEMSVLARWTIRPRLMGVPGVANVAIWGQRERQLQVLVDPERLRDERISLQHVIETAGNALWVSPLTFLDASTPGTGGFIDTPNQRLGIQHILPIRSAADLAQVPIAPEDTGGRIVRLGDIAEVVEDHQPLIGDAIVDDGPGLLLVIEKFPGTDTLAVTRGIEQALEAMKPGLSGIEIDSTVFRPATFIEEAIGNLALALLAGLALLGLVLLVLLGWRSALVGGLTIVISLVAAALVLHLLGTTFNAMILAGLVLAVAVVVDEAANTTGAVVRRLRDPGEDDRGRSRAAIVHEAMLEGRGGLAFASLIVLFAVVPLFFLTDTAGAFLPPLATAYIVAILVSTVGALTVGPAMASLLLAPSPSGRPESRRATMLTRPIERAYERALARAMARSPRLLLVTAVATVGVLVAATAGAVSQTGASLAPVFRERDLLIHWDGAPGTSGPEMSRIVTRATAELRTVPGVSNVGAHVGRAMTSDQVVAINSGEIWLTIAPSADYDRAVEDVRVVVEGYPGFRSAVLTYSTERIGDVLATTADDILVRVYGHEPDVLAAKAEEVRQALTGIDGIATASVEPQVTEPTLEIEVDLAAAQRYGIKAGDVRRAATTLLSGIQVGNLFEEQKVFEVVVWGAPAIRQSVSSVEQLLVQAPGGAYVRLADIARVRIAPALTVIRREGVFRRIDVGAGVSGRDLGAVTRDVEARLQQIPFPLEYHAEVLGASAERQAALLRLLGIVVAAAIGIFLLLQAAFGSWRRAVLVALALPPAAVGGVFGAAASGEGLAIGTIAGFFPLLAIAIRQAVALVDHCQRLEREGAMPFGPLLALHAARDRLGPVVTTALASAAALVPLVVLGDAAGLEIVGPMAAVVIGGLVSSTFVSLFIVPVVLLLSGPSPEPDPASQLVDVPGQIPA